LRLGVFIERVNRRTVFKRAKGTCGICKEKLNPRKWTLDHIIPLSKGGTHEYANVQPAHAQCNRFKADMLPHMLDFQEPIFVGFQPKQRYRNNGKKRKRPRKK